MSIDDLRNAGAAGSIAAFARARIAENRAEVDDLGVRSLVRRRELALCDALDGLVNAMEASANDGSPPVDDVGIEALCWTAMIWRTQSDGSQHPDWDDAWNLA